MTAHRLEDLVAGGRVDGIDPSGTINVVAVEWHGSQAVTLSYRDARQSLQERMLFRSDEGTFTVADTSSRSWTFDGDGHVFRLAAEARRIQLAHLFDPYLALTSSEVDPLPHQIEAVYGEMLPRQPLRFLLADDPGAGKTIMAGLYIKELMIRGDLERCLIVAPGSLVGQWQDELREKFDLRFEILSKDVLDDAGGGFLDGRDRVIARIDQLARRQDVVDRLRQQEWDLVVVDEAHRMAAHFFGDDITKTRRYLLGEVLGATTRHLLLMTATPHSGIEADFQLFLALLDEDRFEGRFRDGVHTVDPSDLMRRMVKERLLTFDGKPLFPERRAYTATYELSPLEAELYAEVTAYVREQMNRADRLSALGQGRRGNTVGFALTLLQRRLASSPEAIYQSLTRRRQRLEARAAEERAAARSSGVGTSVAERRLAAVLSDDADVEDEWWDDIESAEREALEVEIIDAATAAATVAELDVEIEVLRQLEGLAHRSRTSGVDAKWVQLSGLMSEASQMFDADRQRRKLIIFTEHRDTMTYLVDRLRTFLSTPDAVVSISGSTSRDGRRAIQQRFTQDKDTIVLVATDAAGEGVNLQRSHLVINYDLPWNPNRIEQRFGRVHRIGQTEVCHMWNLVADDTREAQVYGRLLAKIEEQRRAYHGQIFDVLGEAMTGAELRDLLLRAIRYGDDPSVQAQIDRVVDATIGERVRDAIEHPPLATETLAFADIEAIRRAMDDAAVRRLQPHYVRAFLEAALDLVGGRLREREPGRFELATVPPAIRARDRAIGRGIPVPAGYERVTFDKDLVHVVGAPIAELLAPGNPLVNAAVDLVLERHRDVLREGAVLVDDRDEGVEPRVLIMLEHAVVDDRPTREQPHTVVSRRFEIVEVARSGATAVMGPAPYLDYRPLADEEQPRAKEVVGHEWLDESLEQIGRDYAIEFAVPAHLAQVRLHVEPRVAVTLAAVKERLTKEMNHWDVRAADLRLQVAAGTTPQVNAELAQRRADAIQERLHLRVDELQRERSLRRLPPVVVGGALVLPLGLVSPASGHPPVSAEARREVERRAIEAVLVAEEELGWAPIDMNVQHPNHPGYDVRSSRRPNGGPSEVRYLEVKGRVAGAPTVTVTRNEILTSLNEPDRYVLALVEVGPDGKDTVRYLRQPFTSQVEAAHFDVTSINFQWSALWDRAQAPS